jgi:chorismate--pyruvate lyase
MGYQEGHWRDKALYSQAGLSHAAASWVLAPGSLTQRLRDSAKNAFKLNVLRQINAKARVAESHVLALKPGAQVLIREVELCVDDQPRVFARTIIPAQTRQGVGRVLVQLGNRPLGELLFNDKRTIRGPIQWTVLYPQHCLYQQAAQCLSTLSLPQRLYARRSVFYLVGKPLLVTEVFLF